MALPKVDEKVATTETVTEAVAEEVSQTVTETEPAPAQAAVEEVAQPTEAVESQDTQPTQEVATTAAPEEKAVAVHKPEQVNAMQILQDQGIDDITLDFSSFPKIILNKGVFSSDDHTNFGTEFNIRYMDKKKSYVLSSEPTDRNVESEVVYSNDNATEASTGRPYVEFIQEWKAKGWDYRQTTYDIVIAECLSGPHTGEFVQLQISPTSQGALGGMLYGLAMKKKDVRSVTWRCAAGQERGSGVRAYTPWTFKEVKSEE